ncbi:15270_t:CDS:1, partial [Gigaspora rosea]
FDKENLQEKLKEVHTYRRNLQNILHKEQQKIFEVAQAIFYFEKND